MACIDHECLKCKVWWSDNIVASSCLTPGCDGEVTNWFDEDISPQGGGEEEEEEAAAHEMPTSADGELKL